MTKRVVSGIRATGQMHLGQYLGVLTRFAEMSKNPELDCYFFVADLHTLTTLKEAQQIREYLPGIVRGYLAAGVDYEKSTIYIQSSVPSVTELSWYLSCLTPVARLMGQPDFKDKSAKKPDDINTGLLTYPVLMSADILGPLANLVPVGKDQTAHLELAAYTARKFNNLYGEYFPIPDAMIEDMITVPGLSAKGDNGIFPKMGKSDGNSINLIDSEEDTRQKIKVSPTDPKRIRRQDLGNPEDCVIYQLHKLVSPPDILPEIDISCKTAAIGCVGCKNILANHTNNLLKDFRERYRELSEDKDLVQDIMATGQRKAAAVFEETLIHVREKMGIKF